MFGRFISVMIFFLSYGVLATNTSTPSRTIEMSLTHSVVGTMTESITKSLALPSTETKTLTSSPTPTISKMVFKAPCEEVDVELRFLIQPSSTPTKSLTLTASVLATEGYRIGINISSCHALRTLEFDAAFDYNRTNRGNAISDVLDVPSSNTDDPVFGFVSISSVDFRFVMVEVLSLKSLVLSIGPNEQYGLYESETVIMSVPAAAFAPEARTDLHVPIVISALSTGVDDTGSQIVGVGSFVLSVVALALANPSTASLVGRISMLADAMTCPNYRNDEQLPFDQNPTRLGFGTEKKLYYHVGATMMNPLLFFFVLFLHFFLALVLRAWGGVMGGKHQIFNNCLTTVHFPSFSVSFAIFMFQGTVTSAVTVYLLSDSVFFTFSSCYVLFLLASTPVLVFLRITGSNFLALRANAENPHKRTHPFVRHVVGIGEWVDRYKKYPGFVAQYGCLFEEYLPKRKWFLAAECVALLVFGALDSISPKTKGGCLVVSGTQSVSLWIFVVAVVGVHPYHNTVSFILFIVISLTQLICSLCITISHVVPVAKREKLLSVAGYSLLGSVLASLLTTVHALMVMTYMCFFGDKREQLIDAWKVDMKRKMKVDRLRRERAENIQVALDAEDDDVYFEGGIGSALNEGDSNSDDSRNVEDADEYEAQRILSSARPVVECPVATVEEEDLYVRQTGLRKKDLWNLL